MNRIVFWNIGAMGGASLFGSLTYLALRLSAPETFQSRGPLGTHLPAGVIVVVALAGVLLGAAAGEALLLVRRGERRRAGRLCISCAGWTLAIVVLLLSSARPIAVFAMVFPTPILPPLIPVYLMLLTGIILVRQDASKSQR